MKPKANGSEDDDCAFLEQVLDQLYDFGSGAGKKKQKKKRRRGEEEEEDEEELASGDKSSSNGGDTKQIPTETVTGETKPARSRVEVVTFQDPTKKQRTKQAALPDRTATQQIVEKNPSEQLEGIDLEKARLEVHRFGITGYKKEQQRVFEQDRAIMLGARPPKKDYVNYKRLQEQIQEKKRKAKEEVQPDLKKKKKKNTREKKKAAPSESGSGPSGQVGRFKNGMLILTSKEIQKIKGKKGSK